MSPCYNSSLPRFWRGPTSAWTRCLTTKAAERTNAICSQLNGWINKNLGVSDQRHPVHYFHVLAWLWCACRFAPTPPHFEGRLPCGHVAQLRPLKRPVQWHQTNCHQAAWSCCVMSSPVWVATSPRESFLHSTHHAHRWHPAMQPHKGAAPTQASICYDNQQITRAIVAICWAVLAWTSVFSWTTLCCTF
jgi:hypothetical protein